jgi:hypothetical protein
MPQEITQHYYLSYNPYRSRAGQESNSFCKFHENYNNISLLTFD